MQTVIANPTDFTVLDQAAALLNDQQVIAAHGHGLWAGLLL